MIYSFVSEYFFEQVFDDLTSTRRLFVLKVSQSQSYNQFYFCLAVWWFDRWNDLNLKKIIFWSYFLAPFKKKSKVLCFGMHGHFLAWKRREVQWKEMIITFTFVRHIWVIQPVEWSSFKEGVFHSHFYLALSSKSLILARQFRALARASSLYWPAVVKINFNFTSIWHSVKIHS